MMTYWKMFDKLSEHLQLYKTSRPEMPYSYKLGKAMPQIVVDGHTKPLSELVGPESWFLFEKLKLTMLEMEWIKINPSNWGLFPGFLKYKKFVLSLHVVYDCAEGGIKLAQDFLESFRHESDKQANLLAVASHRQKFKITKIKSSFKDLK